MIYPFNRGGQWNSGGHCKEASLPLAKISSSFVTEKSVIVEEVIKQMRTPVTVLNTTALSEYRIDGHPSIYGKRTGKQFSSSIQDCSHWCLPGVPDSWNEILYAYLQSKSGSTAFSLLDWWFLLFIYLLIHSLIYLSAPWTYIHSSYHKYTWFIFITSWYAQAQFLFFIFFG